MIIIIRRTMIGRLCFRLSYTLRTKYYLYSFIRLLEHQMQEQERLNNEKFKKLVEEVNKLKEEKEQQKKMFSQSLLLPEDARIDAGLKHEITRLTNENLVGLVE